MCFCTNRLVYLLMNLTLLCLVSLCNFCRIPNRPAYRCNPKETKEIQKQVSQLLKKGYVRKSMSPYTVPVLLVPKKDGS